MRLGVVVGGGALVALGCVWSLRDAQEPRWQGWSPQQALAEVTPARPTLEAPAVPAAPSPGARATPRETASPAPAIVTTAAPPALDGVDALLAEVRGPDAAPATGVTVAAEATTWDATAERPGDRVRHDLLVVELDERADVRAVEAALPPGAVADREPLAPRRSTPPRLANPDPRALEGWLTAREALERTWVVRLHAPVAEPAAVLARLRALPGVLAADFDHEASGAAFAPSDPAYLNGKLYGHDKLRVELAWQAQVGAGVVVAVIDSGLRRSHQDFGGSVWRNPDEVPGNGRDDDGNGYVDDVIGWDFVDRDRSPNDKVGHGTHVAGTIGARANGQGIVGLAPQTRLMIVRILDANNRTTATVGLQGLIYAVENGARLTNQSWGGSRSGWSDAIIQRYANVYMAAWNAGVLNVVSAGNNGRDRRLEMPAALSTVISVSAVNSNGARASFSNYNAHVAGPGVDVFSADADGDASYRKASGTSMAAPHVTGTLALLLERHPEASAPDLVRTLFWTTWDLGGDSLKDYGAGVVDAAATTRQAERMTGTPAELRALFAAQ